MKIGESVRLGAMRKVIKGNFEEKNFAQDLSFFLAGIIGKIL